MYDKYYLFVRYLYFSVSHEFFNLKICDVIMSVITVTFLIIFPGQQNYETYCTTWQCHEEHFWRISWMFWGIRNHFYSFFFFFQKWYLAFVQKLVIVDSIFFPFFPFFPFPSGNCLKIILSTLSNIWPSSMQWLSGINRNVPYHIKQHLW